MDLHFHAEIRIESAYSSHMATAVLAAQSMIKAIIMPSSHRRHAGGSPNSVGVRWHAAHMDDISARRTAASSTRSPGNGAVRRDRDTLDQLLTRQSLVITRKQALQCGMSQTAIHRRAGAGGRWQRILPGVYLTVTGTPTRDQRDTAALLHAGPGSTLTGAAALRRHGLGELRSDTLDVLIPARRRRRSTGFVVLHQTTRLPQQVCYLGPVQYALAARAVADAARGLQDLAAVRAIVAAAVQTRRCGVDQLVTELEAGPVRGSALLRAALAEVTQGVRSVPEADLLYLIKRGKLPMPVLNPQLYVGNELLAVPDAWWPDARVAVEVDSKEWHLSPAKWEETMRRHVRMTSLGILVLHFTPRQIRHESDEVITAIRLALEGRRGQTAQPIRTVPAAR